jgi:hypothetical protein
MDGEADITIGGEGTESLTAFLLPRETLGEGELQGAVTILDQLVEEFGVVPFIRW